MQAAARVAAFPASAAGGWTRWQINAYRAILALFLTVFWLEKAAAANHAIVTSNGSLGSKWLAALAAIGMAWLMALPPVFDSSRKAGWLLRLGAAGSLAMLPVFLLSPYLPEAPLFAGLLFALLAGSRSIAPVALGVAQGAAIVALVASLGALTSSGGIDSLSGWISMAIGIPAAMRPAWIRSRSPGVVEQMFYDGHCGLCHHTVQFLLAEDPDGSRFRFAPLGSDAFVAAIPDERVRAGLPDSVIVKTAGGAVLYRSAAALHVLHRLGGFWRLGAGAAALIPGSWLDAVYDGIARIRHRLFPRPADVCPLMPRELRSRFDGF